MSKWAIWRPDTLIGRELKDALAMRRELWTELRLLAPEAESSLVSEIGDEAALVLPATEENLDQLDLLFYCLEPGGTVDLPPGLPENATTIVLAGDEPLDGLPSVVAGVIAMSTAIDNRPAILLSAHPAAVALAHLLEPLLDLELRSVAATVLLPSSTLGQTGIDDLLGQARSILAFQPPPEESIFGHQLAFNIVPGPFPGEKIAKAVREALADDDLQIAVQASVAGVFHSLLISAYIQVPPSVGQPAIKKALRTAPIIEFVKKSNTLGPIDAAGSSSLHLGEIEATTEPGGFWIRAVMDNLTTGGALNAIGIAEAISEAGATGPSGEGGKYTM